MVESLQQPWSALIIGGSRGIGLALTRELLVNSTVERVYVASRSGQSCHDLAALEIEHGDRLVRLAVDVSDEQSVANAAVRLKAAGVCPGLVLNVAGVLHDQGLGLRPEKRLEDIDSAGMLRVFQVNTVGTALCLKYFLPLMRKDGSSVFAALSARVGSISDNRLGGWYAYRASKAALNQIIKTASVEARRRFPEIVIAALHPGTTDTALSAPFQSNVPEEKLFSAQVVARRLLAVIDDLSDEDSGGFFAWNGEPIPW